MKFRPRLTYANVTATLALFLALGGGAYAATQLPKNSVGTKQLKTNAVKGPKVANNSLTGSDINEAKLGLVPGAFSAVSATTAGNATNADNAANAGKLGGAPAGDYAQKGDLQTEPLHAVGDISTSCDTETGRFCGQRFVSAWANYGNGFAAVGFRKDSGGFVHLQGVANGFGSQTIFYLPQGYRPSDARHEFIAQATCSSGTSYVDIETNGAVTAGESCLSLDGITFHP